MSGQNEYRVTPTRRVTEGDTPVASVCRWVARNPSIGSDQAVWRLTCRGIVGLVLAFWQTTRCKGPSCAPVAGDLSGLECPDWRVRSGETRTPEPVARTLEVRVSMQSTDGYPGRICSAAGNLHDDAVVELRATGSPASPIGLRPRCMQASR